MYVFCRKYLNFLFFSKFVFEVFYVYIRIDSRTSKVKFNSFCTRKVYFDQRVVSSRLENQIQKNLFQVHRKSLRGLSIVETLKKFSLHLVWEITKRSVSSMPGADCFLLANTQAIFSLENGMAPLA